MVCQGMYCRADGLATRLARDLVTERNADFDFDFDFDLVFGFALAMSIACSDFFSFAPSGLFLFGISTHRLRGGLHSFAASRLAAGEAIC